MGISASAPAKINQHISLVNSIHQVANKLTEEYNNKYLDPRFCTRVAMIYNDRLMQFRKNELDGVATSLGLVVDNPRQKQHLCSAIVEHYTNRINLVAAIQASISFCSNRIYALTQGPRCEGSPEIFEQEECTRRNSRWVDTITPPDKNIQENGQWHQTLQHMQDSYISALTRLLDILNQLKDFDQDINDESLHIMGTEVESLLDITNNNCGEMYKILLTMPTFTQAELDIRNENMSISERDSSARQAAMRAVRGLPAIPARIGKK
jgi:hypothetical protein